MPTADLNGEDQRTDKELFDEIIERVLANDSSFKEIILDGKQIAGNTHESKTLWDALVGNTNVRHLSLRGCRITDEEAASLSLVLAGNTAITHVQLGNNYITYEGLEYLIVTLE